MKYQIPIQIDLVFEVDLDTNVNPEDVWVDLVDDIDGCFAGLHVMLQEGKSQPEFINYRCELIDHNITPDDTYYEIDETK